ncbi:Thioredoxin-like fold protein [Metarhizium rileyi]|uniref:Thioredoxin-like fold protein n=1 Tax=Metarhizium rileyi (strain RCEF 4871) TaxID=1649241 RepID=A0A167C1V6_METRR|nr:Thioredoxin-like fold protein [Metarhizium rileyi RCEF 4871]
MPVHNIQSEKQFQDALAEHEAVLIDFYATVCEASKTLAPIFVEQSNREDHEGILFGKIDVDELPALASKLAITSTPTFYFYRNGSKVGESVTPGPQGLLQFIGKSV